MLVLQKLKINVTFFVPSQFDFDNLTLKTEKEPSIIMIRNQKKMFIFMLWEILLHVCVSLFLRPQVSFLITGRVFTQTHEIKRLNLNVKL